MRIAVISDIHGNYTALQAVLRDLERARPDRILAGVDAQMVACGHQHLAFQYRCMSGHLILSTGSIGFPLDGDPRPAYTLLDVEPGRFTATNVRVEYDWRAMLADAERRGYPDMAWLIHVAEKGLAPKQ